MNIHSANDSATSRFPVRTWVTLPQPGSIPMLPLTLIHAQRSGSIHTPWFGSIQSPSSGSSHALRPTTIPAFRPTSNQLQRSGLIQSLRPVAFLTGLIAWMLVAVSLIGTASLAAESASPDIARDAAQRRVVQQQVREMAKRLAGEVLDLQMVQLRENGLETLPLYAELAQMRANLDVLVEAHMQEVIVLLNRLQTERGVKEAERLSLAREKSREILLQLLVERQRLLRRLRMAELESQVRRLIERQTSVREETVALPGMPESARPLAAIRCRENQQDISVLYGQMVAVLEDAATWGEEIGHEAAAATALLKQQNVDAALSAAVRELREANWTAALAHQNQAIAALQQLLTRLQRVADSATSSDPSERSAILQELASRQEELRRRTETEGADPDAGSRLVEEQLAIRKNLEQVAADTLPQAKPVLDRAAQAAAEAAEQLFQGNVAEATRRQDQVLAHIGEAMSQTAEPIPSEAAATANRAQGDPLHDLEEAARALRQARDEQRQASRSAQQDRLAQIAETERQIAASVAAIPAGRQLPDGARSAIEQAASKVGETAQTLDRLIAAAETDSGAGSAQPASPPAASPDANQSPTPSSPDASGAADSRASPTQSTATSPAAETRTAVRSAEQALEKALSVVETEWADLKRARAADAVVNTAREAVRAASTGNDAKAWLEQAKRSAQALAEITSQELQKARSAATAVQRQWQESETNTAAMRRLEQARSALLEAAVAQQLAAGRPQAAVEIRDASETQSAIAKAREAAQQMATPSPSHSASDANLNSAPHSNLNSDANVHSSSDPNPEDQAPAHAAVSDRAEGRDEEASAESSDRRSAQARVVEALNRARNALAEQPDRPELATARLPVEQASAAAAQALQAWSTSPRGTVAAPQQAAAEHIAEAAEDVQRAIEQEEHHARHGLAQREQAAQSLIEQAIPVAPQATAALHRAESAAATGSQAASGEAVAAAEAGYRERLLDAAAAIAAREAQLQKALDAASRLPTLLSPESLTLSSAETEAPGNTPAGSSREPALGALQALQELAAMVARPSTAGVPMQAGLASAATVQSSQASQAAPSASPPAALSAAGRTGGMSRNNHNADRSPASQAASSTAQGAARGQPHPSPQGGMEQPAWMLNLPAHVQAAIRAAAESPPPSAYQQRLRNYFKNVE